MTEFRHATGDRETKGDKARKELAELDKQLEYLLLQMKEESQS